MKLISLAMLAYYKRKYDAKITQMFANFSSGMNVRGKMKYAAMAYADLAVITADTEYPPQNGDTCGLFDSTGSTAPDNTPSLWQFNGTDWVYVSQGGNKNGDTYIVSMIFGLLDGVTYTGGVGGITVCLDGEANSWLISETGTMTEKWVVDTIDSKIAAHNADKKAHGGAFINYLLNDFYLEAQPGGYLGQGGDTDKIYPYLTVLVSDIIGDFVGENFNVTIISLGTSIVSRTTVIQPVNSRAVATILLPSDWSGNLAKLTVGEYSCYFNFVYNSIFMTKADYDKVPADYKNSPSLRVYYQVDMEGN
jgi:hypothetical protein